MIPRIQQEQIATKIKNNKLLLLTGPKRTGKMTVLEHVLDQYQLSNTHVDCANKKTRRALEEDATHLQVETDILVIEEANVEL